MNRQLRGDDGRQDRSNEPLRSGDADRSADPLITTGQLTFGPERVLLHALGECERAPTGSREREAIRAAHEQLGADAPFERGDAAADGGLRDLQLTGGR